MVCWTPSSKTTANCIEVARQLADLGGEPYDCRLHCFKTSHHLTSQSVSHEFEVRACWSLSKAAGASLQRSSGKCASCNGNGINESRLHDDQVSGRLQLKAPCDGLVSQCLVRASTMSRACSGSGIRIVPTTAEVRRAGLNVCLSSLERSQRPLSKLRGSLQKLPLLERKVPGAPRAALTACRSLSNSGLQRPGLPASSCRTCSAKTSCCATLWATSLGDPRLHPPAPSDPHCSKISNLKCRGPIRHMFFCRCCNTASKGYHTTATTAIMSTQLYSSTVCVTFDHGPPNEPNHGIRHNIESDDLRRFGLAA